MKLKKTLLVCLFLPMAAGLLLPVACLSQAPKYSNEFLAIGVGARALGMGNSQVASVADVTGGYWNPAALALIKSDVEVAAMHNEFFAGIGKYDYGSIAARIDTATGRTIAFSIIRFGVDDI